jgi:hypothetical protein
LRLLAGSAAGAGTGILAIRAHDAAWSVNAKASADGAFRLLLRMDDRHWCSLDAEPGRVVARLRIGPIEKDIASSTCDESGPVTLRIGASPPSFGGPDDIELGVVSGSGYRELALFDGRYLSTEVAGGFTGRVIGLQALAGAVTVHEVRYVTL